MADIIRAGSEDGTALVLQPGYPQKTRDKRGKWRLEYLYWCLDTQAESLIPAIDTAPPGGVHTELELDEVRYDRTKHPAWWTCACSTLTRTVPAGLFIASPATRCRKPLSVISR